MIAEASLKAKFNDIHLSFCIDQPGLALLIVNTLKTAFEVRSLTLILLKSCISNRKISNMSER